MSVQKTSQRPAWVLAAAMSGLLFLWCWIAWALLLTTDKHTHLARRDAVRLEKLHDALQNEIGRGRRESQFQEGGPAASARLRRLDEVWRQEARGLLGKEVPSGGEAGARLQRAVEWMKLVPVYQQRVGAPMHEFERKRAEAEARSLAEQALREIRAAANLMGTATSNNPLLFVLLFGVAAALSLLVLACVLAARPPALPERAAALWSQASIAERIGRPLTVINGYADLLLESMREADPVREEVSEIRRAGAQAAAIIEEFQGQKGAPAAGCAPGSA